MSWVDKYGPEKLGDIQGQNSKIQAVLDWYKNPDKGLLVYGPPGVGKTSIAHMLAKRFDLELVEMNASDFRTKDQVNERLLNAAMQQSLFGKDKIILVDEVDGMAGRSDWGGVSAIANLIKKSPWPVYLTCNDNWDRAARSLKGYVQELQIGAPRTSSVAKVLRKIARNEGVEVDKSVIYQLAASRDFRSAITDLETVAAGKTRVSEEDLASLGSRDRKKNIFQALSEIFKATRSDQAKRATDGLDKDADELMLWLDENVRREYKGEDLAKAHEALSRADVFRGRIYRRQDWTLLKQVYALLTVGVSDAKSRLYKGFTRYAPPQYLSQMGRTRGKRAARKSLLGKVAEATHCSRKRARSYLPVIKAMHEQGELPFELDERELKLL